MLERIEPAVEQLLLHVDVNVDDWEAPTVTPIEPSTADDHGDGGEAAEDEHASAGDEHAEVQP
jgi:hypothetical protein